MARELGKNLLRLLTDATGLDYNKVDRIEISASKEDTVAVRVYKNASSQEFAGIDFVEALTVPKEDAHRYTQIKNTKPRSRRR